jgi:hypothetical protein
MVNDAVARAWEPLIACLPLLSVGWYRLHRMFWNFRVAKSPSTEGPWPPGPRFIERLEDKVSWKMVEKHLGK